MKTQASRSVGCLSLAQHTRLSSKKFSKIAFFFQVTSRTQLFKVSELLKFIQPFSFLNLLGDGREQREAAAFVTFSVC